MSSPLARRWRCGPVLVLREVALGVNQGGTNRGLERAQPRSLIDFPISCLSLKDLAG